MAAAAHPWEPVLDFWFPGLAQDEEGKWVLPPAASKMHWMKSEQVDRDVKEKFGALVREAIDGGLADWEADAHGMLAKTLLVDQFPRHIWRGEAGAFQADPLALRLARKSRELRYCAKVAPPQKVFLRLPMMHAEDLAAQAELIAIEKEEGTYAADGFAQKHYDLIEKFGRFPHRNEALGRESTPEELEALKNPGNSF
eukprot:Rhum_TRINITY_DN7306_c0_g2::Rhum_TRINITY_DN7306_c0_g2_i1::g.22496::m.22496